MWSDRTPPDRLRELVAKLRSVLPAPSPGASSVTRSLPGKASIEQVAEVLRSAPKFIGLNRILLHDPLVTVSYSHGRALISGPAGTAELPCLGFEILQAMLDAWSGPSGALLAGFISYDLAAEIEDLEPIPPERFNFPQLYFGLYDSALTFDGESWSLSGTDAWRRIPVDAAEDLIQRAGALEIPVSATGHQGAVLNSRPDRAAFETSVERIVATIRAGDIFQTNLCRCIETSLEPGTEWDLYRRMQSINPAEYQAFLRIDDHRSVLSTSPEAFLKVDGNTVASSPIKGTRRRSSDPAEDHALSLELINSEKDRAELAMIVDVVRNDLGRVCETGSVEVVGHARLMSLPTVHHLFSTVRGRLRKDAGIVDLLRAAFPAASITGAPEIEAMRVAMREEGQARGPCMGAIGWISMDHRLELSVAIRTAFVADGRVRYYAGCGITSDSVPSNEFQESRDKIAAFVRALDMENDRNW